MSVRKRKKKINDIPVFTAENVKRNVKQKIIHWKNTKSERIQELKIMIQNLEQTNKKLCGVKHFHDRSDNLQEIKNISKKIVNIQNDIELEEFVENVTPLLYDRREKNESDCIRQQKNTLFINLFYKSKANITYFHSESCETCEIDQMHCVEESLLICPRCGNTNITVLSNDDDKIDGCDRGKTTPYERSPLYKKYLLQFHENAPNPPSNVISIIYKHLFKVHMMLSTKVKPTPIAQILRSENLQQWAPYSVRISKIINKEKIACLPNELVEKLVNRFEQITKAFDNTKLKQRKKIMNFEFLTKQFLFMENRPDLAQTFCCHKTRNVLNQADDRLYKCSQNLKKDDYKWPIKRSC